MVSSKLLVVFSSAVIVVFHLSLLAQESDGTVAGRVMASTGNPLANVTVTIVNRDTAVTRVEVTGLDGTYSARLPAGSYQFVAKADDFLAITKQAVVRSGSTTVIDFLFGLQDVTTQGGVQLSGTVTRQQLQGIPLNGGNFLDLAKLEPGVQSATRTADSRVLIPFMGAPGGNNGRNTRVTFDGGSVMTIGNGGAAMTLSKEAVQELQITTVNFDLSTGLTASGSIKAVTRSGDNDLHGTAWFVLRDHNLAAHPGLQRDAVNPDPFFQRRQFGAAVGGPIRRDRSFFFANYERSEQRSVVATVVQTPEFEHFGRIAPSPLFGTQLGLRIDFRFSADQYLFVRHSHEDSRQFAPVPGRSPADPSNWLGVPGWFDQSMAGLTSLLGEGWVNNLRVSYLFSSTSNLSARKEDCPKCIAIGSPQITVAQTSLVLGRSQTATTLARRYQVHDALSSNRGKHQLRFGFEWEYSRGRRVSNTDEPVTITLFSPARVRDYNALASTTPDMRIPLPSSFLTVNDILQLPVQRFSIGAGPAGIPQRNFGDTRIGHIVRLYFQDTWRLHPRFTLNYGLGWGIDAQWNYDLRKPSYLAAIIGSDNLDPTEKNWRNVSPVVGFAWNPQGDQRTVVRLGGGVYYDPTLSLEADDERYSLNPRGTGRLSYPETRILNPLAGIPGLPPGQPFNLTGNPTLFTGARLMEGLGGLRAQLEARRNPENHDFSITNIEADKTGTVYLKRFGSQYASHVSAGLEREMLPHMVIAADFVYRHFINTPTPIDFNHYNSSRGPVLPRCAAAQLDDPSALCSSGPINVRANVGRATYKGLRLRMNSTVSDRLHVLVSYAYSRNTGLNTGPGSGFNLDNWFESYGPLLGRDIPHLLNISGIVKLPRSFQLGFNVSYSSPGPFSAWVGGNDFNGDGITGDLLPGSLSGQFGRRQSKRDLEKLIADFNQNYANRLDTQRRSIPRLELPRHYEFEDAQFSQDLRISRTFILREQRRITLLADVFNVLNIANLQGYTGDLTDAAFGQPTSRVAHAFGSGGPRAFQAGVRIGF